MSCLTIPRPDKEINKMSMLWWIHIIQLDEEEGKIRHSCVWSTITLFMGQMMGHPGWGGLRWGGWRLIKLNYMLMSVVSRGRWSIYLTQYPFPRTSFRSQSVWGALSITIPWLIHLARRQIAFLAAVFLRSVTGCVCCPPLSSKTTTEWVCILCV